MPTHYKTSLIENHTINLMHFNFELMLNQYTLFCFTMNVKKNTYSLITRFDLITCFLYVLFYCFTGKFFTDYE